MSDQAPDVTPDPVTTEQLPTEGAAQVIGLSGAPVQIPSGRWLAEVDDRGELVRQDGLLVRVR